MPPCREPRLKPPLPKFPDVGVDPIPKVRDRMPRWSAKMMPVMVMAKVRIYKPQ